MVTTGKTVVKPEIRVSVRVDAALMLRIDRIAEASGISASDVVRMALNRQLPPAAVLPSPAPAAVPAEPNVIYGECVVDGISKKGFHIKMGGKKGRAA